MQVLFNDYINVRYNSKLAAQLFIKHDLTKAEAGDVAALMYAAKQYFDGSLDKYIFAVNTQFEWADWHVRHCNAIHQRKVRNRYNNHFTGITFRAFNIARQYLTYE